MRLKKRPLSATKKFKRYLVTLGSVLRDNRTELRLSLDAVAKCAGLEPKRLAAIEVGEDETLDLLLVDRLASILGSKTHALFLTTELRLHPEQQALDVAIGPFTRQKREQLGMSVDELARRMLESQINYPAILKACAHTVRTERERRGLTIQELARKSEVSIGQIRRIESGLAVPTSTLVDLATGFDMEATELVKLVRQSEFYPKKKTGK
jgi:transcriptional regulator with XRE-family HTH domain